MTALFLLAWTASAFAQSTTLAPTHFETPAHQAELRRARAAIENDLKADPKNDALWLHVAFIEHKLGDYDAAQSSFEKVVELNPEESAADYMLALIFEKKGDKKRALSAWKECVARSKDPNLLTIAEKHLAELHK